MFIYTSNTGCVTTIKRTTATLTTPSCDSVALNDFKDHMLILNVNMFTVTYMYVRALICYFIDSSDSTKRTSTISSCT